MPLLTTPHQPEFTAEQLSQARKIAAAHAAPHHEVLRARLTLLINEHPGISHLQAARRCGLDRHTVYRWRRRWAQRGWSLADAPRSGRPRSFSPGGDDARQSPGV
jgi:hypothetical protein